MLKVCCGLCRPFGWEVWIPESRHLKSQNISLYCIIRKGLCSVFECVLNFTFDQLLYWVVVAEFHWFETRTRKSECTWIGMECFWAGECSFTWASLWLFFFFTEEECYAPSGRPLLTFERNMPDTEIFLRFSAERKRFLFSTEQVCCQKDCCTLIQYLFTNVKNTAASWLLLRL